MLRNSYENLKAYDGTIDQEFKSSPFNLKKLRGDIENEIKIQYERSISNPDDPPFIVQQLIQIKHLQRVSPDFKELCSKSIDTSLLAITKHKAKNIVFPAVQELLDKH
jgi:UDP-N-acetylglucosamine transferase subunit ALG13